MARTDAQRRAENKYKATLKPVTLRIKHEEYDAIEECAIRQGTSVRNYILSAVFKQMAEDGYNLSQLPESKANP